jgi:hypothetical protein
MALPGAGRDHGCDHVAEDLDGALQLVLGITRSAGHRPAELGHRPAMLEDVTVSPVLSTRSRIARQRALKSEALRIST